MAGPAIDALLALAFDVLLVLGLLVLAWQSVNSPSLFRGIVLFIAFGLLMALAWLRLGAPDVAMAEAAVGAGLTGVLLLNALAAVGEDKDAAHERRASRGLRAAVLGGGLAVAGLAVWSLAPPGIGPGVGARVHERLSESGVGNPVTAVLLNFRALDTLVEVAVLIAAVAGAAALRRAAPAGLQGETPRLPPSPLLHWFVPRVVPIAALVAAYLWWAGAKLPGGAFQAGAVLGAAAIMPLLADVARPPRGGLCLRGAVAAGFGVFLCIGMAAHLAGGAAFLDYPAGWDGRLIVAIELLLTASIAASLFALAARGRGVYSGGGRDE